MSDEDTEIAMKKPQANFLNPAHAGNLEYKSIGRFVRIPLLLCDARGLIGHLGIDTLHPVMPVEPIIRIAKERTRKKEASMRRTTWMS